MRIAHASRDENNRYSAGRPGDQDGKEVCIREWYNRPWTFVARPKSRDAAQIIAQAAAAIANNPNVGYAQDTRGGLYDECVRIGWALERIGEIRPCNCDCSSFAAVCCNFAGIEIPSTVWTGNLEYYFISSGSFLIYRGSEYIGEPQRLRAGDILVNTLHHCAIALDDGSMAGFNVNYLARVNVSKNGYLQVRTTAGVGNNEYMRGGMSLRLPNDFVVRIVEEVGNWGRIGNINGWVYLGYLVREVE